MAGGLTGHPSPPGRMRPGRICASGLRLVVLAAFAVSAEPPAAHADGAFGHGDGITAFAELLDDTSVVVHYRIDDGADGPAGGIEARSVVCPAARSIAAAAAMSAGGQVTSGRRSAVAASCAMSKPATG